MSVGGNSLKANSIGKTDRIDRVLSVFGDRAMVPRAEHARKRLLSTCQE